VYDPFRRWQRDGTLDAILRRLQMRLDSEERIDFDLWCVDAPPIRASRSAAGAEKKRPPGEPEDHALGAAKKRHPLRVCMWIMTADELAI